ncbi:MAG: cytochrome c, partial [Bacteroidetes bacterium]|nr:cytochrome c [Bacteroidota bacterium]
MKPKRYFFSINRSICLLLFVLFVGFIPSSLNAQPSGQELFANNCASCHKIDQPMVGPA